MYKRPYCAPPINSKWKADLGDSPSNRKKGRKTGSVMNNRAQATNEGLTPARFSFIKLKENAQIKEVMIR